MSNKREDCIHELNTLVQSLKRHASPGKARISTGPHRAMYPRHWDELQGFARPLWGMAALAASGEGDRLGAETWKCWREGLINGTNPQHPEYWGIPEHKSQAFCEMPAIAISLLWAPEWLWKPLNSSQKKCVLDWLSWIQQRELNQNNWIWFRVIVNAVFLQLDWNRFNKEQLREDLYMIECMYEGNGWYVDGRHLDSRTADSYIPEAFHFYGLIASELLAKTYPEISRELTTRAEEFSRTWQWFTSNDGAMIAWGRSLTYRYTPASFWSMCAMVNLEVLPWARSAHCWSQQRDWWKPINILNDKNCLSLGFTYPNERVAEPYIAHTSPYWLTKIFVALRQPEDHPFW